MKIIKTISIIALLLSCTSIIAQRQKVRLDEGWRFHFGNASSPEKDFGCGTEYFNYLTKAASIHNEGPYSLKFDDSNWQEVRIPHDWVTGLPYASNASHSHGYKTVGYKFPETSVGWYRKVMHFDESERGKNIKLQFDGIFRNSQIWFNGIFMGNEPSGYATQVYDITDYIKYGEDNLLCVRADASLEEGWFYEGAGIYRDVWMITDEMLHVAPFGTFVYSTPTDYGKGIAEGATLTVSVDVENSSLIEHKYQIKETVLNAEGETVATMMHSSTMSIKSKETLTSEVKMQIDKPHLWDIDSPYLYTLRTEIIENDNVTTTYDTPFGIRTIEFTADNGFFLNGKNIKLKGVNMHQDHAGVGAAIPDALQAWRIKQLKSFGCNAYRASHNPMTPALLDVCDREGMLVIDENRLMGTNKYHVSQLENMIRRDRNHPSIILWSNGNEEWGLENAEIGKRMAESMREITARLDPTRSSCIANAGGGELIKGLDIVGYNYIIQNNVYNRRKEHPEWKIVGTEETTGCGTRGIYEYDKEHPGRMPSMNRTYIADGKLNNTSGAGLTITAEPQHDRGIEHGWKFFADTPWAAGCFYWTGFDYRGEPNPLSYPAHDSQFGILDYCGFWKDEAYYLKSVWTDVPTVHIAPHWNLKGHEGDTIDVWAYSNGDEVELNLNGRSYGRKQMPRNGHISWRVPYVAGRLTATAYKNGKKFATEIVETTGNASTIRINADRTTLIADGQDVAVVNLDLLDKKSRIVPDACEEITITIEGNARIIGAGNGDSECKLLDHPVDKDCKQFTFPAFNGHCQFILQSTKESGRIIATCKMGEVTKRIEIITT